MRKLALFSLIAAGAVAAYVYLDRRAMSRERARFAQPTDAMLARSVQQTLAAIAGPDAVQVTVHDGAVTLRGELDRARRDRALRAALAVPGVKSVVNRLDTLGPAPAPDEIPGVPVS